MMQDAIPPLLSPKLDTLPAELTARPQWVVWKLEPRPGEAKPTKIPYNAKTGDKADSTDALTWTDFETAQRAFERGGYSGVGFVFSTDDEFAGMDLDNCRDPATGALHEDAQAILERLNSYAEVSPSGTGIKVIVRAVHPGQGFRKALKDGRGYEMYDAARYFTLTGQRLPDCPPTIAERRGEFAAIHREIFTKPKPEKPAARPVRASLPGDAELLDKARSAANGHTFAALYDSSFQGLYGSQSEADLSLCGSLAFWTGGDMARMDGLFRSSGLMREKWDEQRGALTYGQRTLNMALAGTTEFYDPKARGKSGPSAEELAARAIRPKATEGQEEGEAANTDEGDACDAADLIAQIRETKDPIHAKRKAMSAVIVATLEADGQLHRDADGGLWHFDNERHELLQIPGKKDDGGEAFLSRLARRVGLNRTEPAFAHVLADVQDAARALSCVSRLQRWSWYDPKTRRLYVSDGGGFVYRLDGKAIHRQFNGADGVLFAEMPEMTPLGAVDIDAPEEPGSGLKAHILDVHFDDTADLTRAAQEALWSGYVYALPFESILPTKPIPVFIGEKGSGKSVALKRLARLLLGPTGNVSPVPAKEENFDAGLLNSRFLFLDNVDTYRDWLMDALACAATGGQHLRRTLYATNGLSRYTPRCWIGLTTREPKFRRDDVADRALLFRLARIPDEQRVAEHSLMQAIDERRAVLFAEYLRDLNRIVECLRSDRNPVAKVETRMADWGDFFLRLMRMVGHEDDGRAALRALANEQMTFTVAGDPLFEMLDLFVPDDGSPTPEKDAAELCKTLMMLAEDEKRKATFTPHGLGARLKNSADAINRAYHVKSREGGGHKRFYRFARRLEENEKT